MHFPHKDVFLSNMNFNKNAKQCYWQSHFGDIQGCTVNYKHSTFYLFRTWKKCVQHLEHCSLWGKVKVTKHGILLAHKVVGLPILDKSVPLHWQRAGWMISVLLGGFDWRKQTWSSWIVYLNSFSSSVVGKGNIITSVLQVSNKNKTVFVSQYN